MQKSIPPLSVAHGMVAELSLVECLSDVEDPRIDPTQADATKAHSLLDTLVLSVLAVLCDVEHSFHWVLDMTFNEDQSRIRKDHGPDHLALLRQFALNVLSLGTSKESTRKKRKRAAWDESYLRTRLAAMI